MAEINEDQLDELEDNISEIANTEVESLLNNVKDMGDLYFIALLLLSKMEGSSKYSMMSELAYLLDSQSFINLLWYYEGQTIRIPTRAELKDILQMMNVYYHYHVLEETWKDSLLNSGFPNDKKLHNRTWTRYKKFLKNLESVELPKALRRPCEDDKLKMEGLL